MKSILSIPLLLAAVIFGLSGCAIQGNERAELTASYHVFSSTVSVLADLRDAGRLSDNDIVKATTLINLGMDYLTEWERSVLAGEENPKAKAGIRIIIEQLATIQEASVHEQ